MLGKSIDQVAVNGTYLWTTWVAAKNAQEQTKVVTTIEQNHVGLYYLKEVEAE